MRESSSGEGPGPEPRHAQPAPDPSVLESVLRETLSRGEEPLSAAQMEALRQVVQRHAGETFALQPHGVELVRTLLSDGWGAERMDAGLLANVALQVATSLAEAPDVWQRVERLWQRLGRVSGPAKK